jgi:hypothetical protein
MKKSKIAEVLHTYGRKGVNLITPSKNVARFRDDFASPAVVGKLIYIDGAPVIVDEFADTSKFED